MKVGQPDWGTHLEKQSHKDLATQSMPQNQQHWHLWEVRNATPQTHPRSAEFEPAF